ncbi:MAG: LysR family transcriptional regulator [Anaerovoracaceae bacterium]
MELRVLRYFLAVAREENITAAANSLHVTQPTLSKQLKDLEEELGKKLFTRGNRKITLTEEGIFLRKRAQEITDLVDKTEAEFQTDDENLAGDIYIGGGETRVFRHLARTFARLHGLYPNIRLNLYSGNGEDVSERLNKGLIDFGLFVGTTDLKDYDYLVMPEADTWGLIMRKDDPLASHESITPEDLYGIPLLVSRQAMIRNELSGWMGYSFDKLNVIGTYNLIYNASVMVEEGLGSAISIDKLVNTTGDSDLCFRPFAPAMRADLIIAWKKYQVFSRAAEKFLEVLQEELAAPDKI